MTQAEGLVRSARGYLKQAIVKVRAGDLPGACFALGKAQAFGVEANIQAFPTSDVAGARGWQLAQTACDIYCGLVAGKY